MQKILKILLAVGVVAFSVFMTATSCDKKDPSGGSGGGSDNTSLSLFLTNIFVSADVVKTTGNTAVVNASTLSKAFNSSESFARLFAIRSQGAKAVLFFVSRTDVTKDTITVKAASDTPCSTTESEANALAAAAGGAHCREYLNGGRQLLSTSYLGTVFNNTKTTTHARGTLSFESRIYGYDKGKSEDGAFSVISDTTTYVQSADATAKLRVAVNTGVTATINEAWVTDSGSTTEVELYAIGIDVSGRTIEEFSGLKKADFDKEIENATFKKMLEKSKWADLKFKVKIVNATDFAAAQ